MSAPEAAEELLDARALRVIKNLLGGAFLAATGQQFRLLFALSVALRLLLALLAARLVRPRQDGGDTGVKELLLRGLRGRATGE